MSRLFILLLLIGDCNWTGSVLAPNSHTDSNEKSVGSHGDIGSDGRVRGKYIVALDVDRVLVYREVKNNKLHIFTYPNILDVKHVLDSSPHILATCLYTTGKNTVQKFRGGKGQDWVSEMDKKEYIFEEPTGRMKDLGRIKKEMLEKLRYKDESDVGIILFDDIGETHHIFNRCHLENWLALSIKVKPFEALRESTVEPKRSSPDLYDAVRWLIQNLDNQYVTKENFQKLEERFGRTFEIPFLKCIYEANENPVRVLAMPKSEYREFFRMAKIIKIYEGIHLSTYNGQYIDRHSSRYMPVEYYYPYKRTKLIIAERMSYWKERPPYGQESEKCSDSIVKINYTPKPLGSRSASSEEKVKLTDKFDNVFEHFQYENGKGINLKIPLGNNYHCNEDFLNDFLRGVRLKIIRSSRVEVVKRQ